MVDFLPREFYKSHFQALRLSDSDSTGSEELEITNINTLKETQLLYAPTRRQKVIAKRRKGFHLKKKTELCKHYLITQMCPKGDDCAFAHGQEELRARPINNYRTVKCRHFQEKGWCQYGPRCQFMHNDPQGNFKSIKISYDQLMRSMQDSFKISVSNGVEENIEDFLQARSNIEANALPKLDIFKKLR